MIKKIDWIKEYDLYEDRHDEVEMEKFIYGNKELTEEELEMLIELETLIERQNSLTKEMAERIPAHWKKEAILHYQAKLYRAAATVTDELIDEMRCYIEIDEDAYYTAVTEQEDYELGEYGAYIKEVNRRY